MARPSVDTLSLHDALPISDRGDTTASIYFVPDIFVYDLIQARVDSIGDRKSTRLNSSHLGISYGVFCLKKKNDVMMVVMIIPDAGEGEHQHAVEMQDEPTA